MNLEHAAESQPARLAKKYSRNCFKTALQLSADLGCLSAKYDPVRFQIATADLIQF